ncbi:MAG: chemotaxis protein CheW [Pseudomonadota bacterium]
MPVETNVSVNCLLIPLLRFSVVVPVSTTVEVYRLNRRVHWRRGNNCMLGEIQWRGQVLPVVTLDEVEYTNVDHPDHAALVVIMRSLLSKTEPRLYALSTCDVPKLLHVDAHNTDVASNPSVSHAYANGYLQVNGESAMIPDLEKLEGVLTTALRQQRAQRDALVEA